MNNKGFAFSTMLYGFMIIGCLIFLIILGLMSTNRTNTREMVNLIEDDSARLSLTNRTFSTNDAGKDYRDFDVPLGYGGWYKLEAWGHNLYAAKTVFLPELTTVRFFLGTTSTDTLVCINNIYSPNLSDEYNTLEAANAASDGLTKTEIETPDACTANSNQGLILSTASGTVSYKSEINELGDGDAYKNENDKYVVPHYSINNSTAKNKINNIASSSNKVRITFVSNNNTITETSACGIKGHSGVYYIKNSSNKFLTTTSSNAVAFTGNNNQRWLIECNYASTPVCTAKNLATPTNVINNFSCSTYTAIAAGY